ncbi:LysR family transcriptional regulator [Roseibium algae]|uniref:LysR family transcriptional regulator n=1 Tax=Roseibium algae TaxID=3123038 RepID=A0ABU8TRR1_9HYPH
MATNLPPLSAIRAFEAASRHLSFTRAAEELGMTQAAVSYQIKLLEEKLGFALFVRLPRKIELTEKGLKLSGQVILAFGSLRDAFDDIVDQDANHLVISSNTTLAVNWLATRIHKFQALNADLTIRILPYGPSGIATPDAAVLSADVMISACYKPPKDWLFHDLVPVTFTPMLSPALAQSVGGIHTPLDLLKVTIIDPQDDWWAVWFSDAGYPDLDLSHLPSSRMGSQALEANRAIAGHGVAILTPYLNQTALDTGLLLQPFDIISAISSDSWNISYPQSNKNSRKVRLFRDWVFAEMRQDGLPIPISPVMRLSGDRQTNIPSAEAALLTG